MVWTTPVPPTIVPQKSLCDKLVTALLNNGLLTNHVETAINTLPEPTSKTKAQIEWNTPMFYNVIIRL